MADDVGFLARMRSRFLGDRATNTADTEDDPDAPEPGGEVVDGTVAGQDVDEHGDEGVAIHDGDPPVGGAAPTLTSDLSLDPSTSSSDGANDLPDRLDLRAGPDPGPDPGSPIDLDLEHDVLPAEASTDTGLDHLGSFSLSDASADDAGLDPPDDVDPA